MHKAERLLAAGITLAACFIFILPWTIALTHLFRRLP